ncbi:MAG: hypothetical protein LBV63_01630 [Candidatus Methanoplasma sp.]|jgi:hypothetical protein|nr:hypothetical protein [Candidatus Methanoplasma sp.]
MRNKILATVLVVALVAVSLAAFNGNVSDLSEDAVGLTIEKREFSDRNTIVFSDSFFLSDVKNDLKDYTSKISISSEFNSVNKQDIVVIDESWIYKNDTEQIDLGITDILTKQVPIIFVGENSYLSKDSAVKLGAYGNSEGDIVYAVYGINGVGYSYSIESDNKPEALALAYAWAHEISSSDTPWVVGETFSWMRPVPDVSSEEKAQGQLSAPLGAPASSSSGWIYIDQLSKSLTCGSYGYFTDTVDIYKYDLPTQDLYSLHHYQHVQPTHSNGYRVADIYLLGEYTVSDLRIAAPTSTSGSNGSSTSVTVGGGASASGPGVNGSTSFGWSYNISDVILRNTSGPATGEVNYWHDVDESRNVGYGYTAEPGITVSVGNGSTYLHTDYHEVQFCKEVPIYINVLGIHVLYGYTYINFQTFQMPMTVRVLDDAASIQNYIFPG